MKIYKFEKTALWKNRHAIYWKPIILKRSDGLAIAWFIWKVWIT